MIALNWGLVGVDFGSFWFEFCSCLFCSRGGRVDLVFVLCKFFIFWV